MARNATGKRSDPFMRWSAWLDRSERDWNASLNRLMEGEVFAGLLDAGETLWLTLNDLANATRRRTWHALGLPTRDDVVHIARQLGELEDQLRRLEERIGRFEPGASTRVTPLETKRKRGERPRRTRKPPGAE